MRNIVRIQAVLFTAFILLSGCSQKRALPPSFIAENGSISGTVLAYYCYEDISNATTTRHGAKITAYLNGVEKGSAVTDLYTGYYVIGDLSVGTYDLEILIDEYETYNLHNITVTSGLHSQNNNITARIDNSYDVLMYGDAMDPISQTELDFLNSIGCGFEWRVIGGILYFAIIQFPQWETLTIMKQRLIDGGFTAYPIRTVPLCP